MAADQGLPAAQLIYGELLRTGDGVDKNASEGARYLKLAADNGVPGAQAMYAECLVKGEGVPVDLNEAVRYTKMYTGDAKKMMATALQRVTAIAAKLLE